MAELAPQHSNGNALKRRLAGLEAPTALATTPGASYSVISSTLAPISSLPQSRLPERLHKIFSSTNDPD